MRPSCWHQNFGPNGLSGPAQGLCLNLFSSITTDFNISSALRWAIQDQWSSGFVWNCPYSILPSVHSFKWVHCKGNKIFQNKHYIVAGKNASRTINQGSRVQARGRLRRNTCSDGVNFVLEGTAGEKTSPDICSFCKSRYLYCQLYWKQNENICHKWTWNIQITWQNTFKRCSDYFGV